MKKLLAIVLFCAFLVPYAYGEKFTYPDGGTYEGKWKKSAADEKIEVRTGRGTYTSPNGDKYVGEFKEGKENGQGTQTWSNGDKYVGEWKDGNWNGQGTFTWVDGRKNEGKWKDGKPWKTSEYDKNGNIIGRWKM